MLNIRQENTLTLKKITLPRKTRKNAIDSNVLPGKLTIAQLERNFENENARKPAECERRKQKQYRNFKAPERSEHRMNRIIKTQVQHQQENLYVPPYGYARNAAYAALGS